MSTRSWWIVAPLVIACNSEPVATDPPVRTLAEFTDRADAIRQQLGIPGVAGVVMLRDSIVWEGMLGDADVASRTPVTRATQFHIASLTKTFASTIVMQLVEQGLVNLDTPVSTYGVSMPNANTVLVRHLLSHTSEGVPGASFSYSGDRYVLLDEVIQRASGEPFNAFVTGSVLAGS